MVKIKLINVVKMIMAFIFAIISIWFLTNWVYNFMALDDTKLYDDNNKYIDPSLPSPDIESNLKSSYKLKLSINKFLLGIINFINMFKKIFVVIFGALIIYMIFLNKETGIIPLMKEVMYKRRK